MINGKKNRINYCELQTVQLHETPTHAQLTKRIRIKCANSLGKFDHIFQIALVPGSACTLFLHD